MGSRALTISLPGLYQASIYQVSTRGLYGLARRLAAAFSRAAAARSAGVFFLGGGGAHVHVVLHECRSGTAAFLPTARPTRFEDRRAGHALPYHARGARCTLCAAAGATRSCER